MQQAAMGERARNARLFEQAVTGFVAEPGNSKSIATMMRLACEAPTPQRRKWAARWLFIHCNVVVAEEDNDNAVKAATARLR